jgi:hypothetical protein
MACSSVTTDKMLPTPEGYLLAKGVRIARTGAMLYSPHEVPVSAPIGGGPVVISRGEDELFDPAFLESLIGRPVTLQHPEDWVTADNYSDVAVGTILAVSPSEDGRFVVADVIINDARAVAAVKGGIRELSVGYDAEYVEDAPGVGRQNTLRANHLAIVPRGRCGASCCIDAESVTVPKEKTIMSLFREKLFAAIGRVIDEADTSKDAAADVPADAPVAEAEVAAAPADEVSATEEPASAAVGDEDPFATLHAKLDAILGMLAAQATEEATESESEGEGEMSSTMYCPECGAEMVQDMCSTDRCGMRDSKVADAALEIDADTLSRGEILAPGIKPQQDFKQAALVACRATTDGSALIDSVLDGGRFEDADVDTLFRVASTLMRDARREKIAAASRVTVDRLPGMQPGPMTAAKLAELHAAHWAARSGS